MKANKLLFTIFFILLASCQVIALELSLQGPTQVCQGRVVTYYFKSDHEKSYSHGITVVQGGIILSYTRGDTGQTTNNYNQDGIDIYIDISYYRGSVQHSMTVLWTGPVRSVNRINYSTITDHSIGPDTFDSKTLDVEVIAPAAPPTAQIPASQYGAYNVCAGGTFISNFTTGQSAVSTSWSTPTGDWLINGRGGIGINGVRAYNIGSGNTVRITAPAGTPPGQYEVHASATDACGRSDGYSVILVNVGLAAYSEVAGPQDLVLRRYYNYDLVGTGATNIQWTVPDGLILYSGQGTSTIRVGGATTPGSGAIIATFTDQCGNPDTYALLDVVWQNYYREAFTSEVTTSASVVYPNPASNEVTLSGGKTATQVMFYDNQGVLRKSLKLATGGKQTQVSVQDLPEGFYYVRIIREGQAPLQQQLHIQR
jgi:hypothetical protein